MERSRNRTDFIQRSKGACIAALLASLGCACFGVGGAAAGDGKYARHVRQARLEARIAGAALSHRTPEQLVLAITPKSHRARAPRRAPAPAAASTPAPAASTSVTDTTAQPATTSTTLTDTKPTPAAAGTAPTTGATSNVDAGVTGTTNKDDATAAVTPATIGPATPDTKGTSTTSTTDTSTPAPTGPSTPDTKGASTTAAVTPAAIGPATPDTKATSTTDSTSTTDTSSPGFPGHGWHGRPVLTSTTTTGTTTTGATTTAAATTTTIGNGRPAGSAGTGTGSTVSACHGRCPASSQGDGVLPASLPSSTSQGNAPFGLTIAPAAVTTPAATTTPTATPTPTNAASSPTQIVTNLPPAATTTKAPSGRKTQLTGSFKSLTSASALETVSHGRTNRGAGSAQPRTAGTGAASAGSVATGPAAPTGGTAVTAATAAGTRAAATHRTHTTTNPPSSGGSSLPGPIGSSVRVFNHIVKVIPTPVWVALGAAFGLALAFGALALRAGRRARRREREFKAISAAAATDALTGILNRRGFMDAAERELARASRYDRPFVLAYVDVRGLKAVNDTEGHLVGDELIKAVAGLMKESARADDVVARIGGDEFALLLDEQTAQGAEPVLRRIRSRVEERRAAMEIRVPWELTIGIAAFPGDGTTLEELLGTADRRLYEQRGIALR